jgi:putative transposase
VRRAQDQKFPAVCLLEGSQDSCQRSQRRLPHASSENEARENLETFPRKWDGRYPTISKSWQANWQRVIPFFAYPEEIRRIIYTTNAIESLNNTLKKTIKNRASFPNDEAAVKLLYLSLRNIQKKWTMPARHWGKALNQFAILYSDRMP